MPVAADLAHTLSAPWGEPIMQRALADVVVLALVGGALGCWIVLYGLSYSAESLAHGLFPGLVLSALTGIPLVLGGALGLVVAALAIALASRAPGIGRDTAVAVVITALVGLGALLALSPDSPPGIQNLLFGDVLAVSDLDLLLGAILTALALAALYALHGQLLLVGFDRTNARALGGRPLLADAALLLLLAAAILVSIQGLGNLLVIAVLVAPAATARLLARRIVSTMAAGVAVAVAGGVGGLYLSYYAGTAAGASIAASVVTLYLVALGAAAARERLAGDPLESARS
jgi:ABC-type Mn2+/Zn2+ transport system permease subunit